MVCFIHARGCHKYHCLTLRWEVTLLRPCLPLQWRSPFRNEMLLMMSHICSCSSCWLFCWFTDCYFIFACFLLWHNYIETNICIYAASITRVVQRFMQHPIQRREMWATVGHTEAKGTFNTQYKLKSLESNRARDSDLTGLMLRLTGWSNIPSGSYICLVFFFEGLCIHLHKCSGLFALRPGWHWYFPHVVVCWARHSFLMDMYVIQRCEKILNLILFSSLFVRFSYWTVSDL